MTYPRIGSGYTGPDFSRPALRRLPHGWVLEETRQDRHQRTWFRVRRWLWIAFLATAAFGYVVAVKAVLT
mgnify:CR=1 FL=1